MFVEGKVRLNAFMSKCSYLYVENLRARAPTPSLLFALPEHQVHEAADESHGEADPSQDVGGAVGALLKTDHVKAVFLSRVDRRCNHHTQRGQQLDDGSEDESLSLLEPEELKDEDEEADAT